jgi:hypothetical protein
MLFSYGCGQQQIDNNKKCSEIAGDIDCHADAAVWRWANCPMEHIQGYIGNHRMPSLGKCLHGIAPAAVVVDKFIENTQNTNKTQLLASNYGTNQSLVVYENFLTA